MPPTAIALLAAAFLYVSGTLLARRLRDWHAAEWMHLTLDSLEESESPVHGLEALGAEVVRFIREQAEAAALAAAFGGNAPGNPHPAGTRARVLWETSYHARLIYLTGRPAARSGPDLAAGIERLRAQRPARVDLPL